MNLRRGSSRRVLTVVPVAEQNDIWIRDLARQTLQRLPNDPGMKLSPVWTPDGKRVAFTAERDGVQGVYWQAADGSRSGDLSSPGGP